MQKSAEKCRKRSRIALSVLIVCVAVILLSFSDSASAITGITSDLIPDEYIDGVPCLIRNNGDAGYELTLTAENPIGTITWYGEVTIHDTGEVKAFLNDGGTGNTQTFGLGIFSSNTYRSCIIRAVDSGGTGENTSREYRYIVRNANYTGTIETPHFVLSPDQSPTELPIGIISPVPDLSPDVITRLAQNISIDPSELILLTSADFDPSDPPEPTQAMRQEVSSQNGQFLAKLNTIKVNKDGWYVFKVTVSDDIKGMSVNDLKLFEAEGSDFTSSFGMMSIFNGVTGMYEVTNLFGLKVDTVEKQILVTMLLSAGKSITTYFVKILLMLLAGGCSAGIGIGAVFVVAGIIATKIFKRRR